MAWTHEQSKGSATQPVAYNNNVKAGSLLLACLDVDWAGVPLTAPTDTRGNNWTLIRSVLTANAQYVAWWYAVSNGAGACTVSMFDATFEGWLISEFSASAGVPTLDAENTVYRSGVAPGVDAFSSASINIADAGSLALSLIGSDNGTTGSVSAGTGCVLGAQQLFNGGGDVIALEYILSASAGARTMPWTPSVTFDGQVHIASFKEVSSGGLYAQRPPKRARGISW